MLDLLRWAALVAALYVPCGALCLFLDRLSGYQLLQAFAPTPED